MTAITLMSDPRIAAIPVVECGEGLIDVRLRGAFAVDVRKEDPEGAFALLREGVVQRLAAAQGLLPDGLGLLLIEGYRPPARQRLYFEEYAETLRRGNPDWSPAQVRDAASRYVSPPEIAPHSAGPAVDLTLVSADDGRELDMGTRVNASPEESDGACYTNAGNVDTRAGANRRILGEALTAAGLVNYATEWWHWSYGDRYWAFTTGADAAIYGSSIHVRGQ